MMIIKWLGFCLLTAADFCVDFVAGSLVVAGGRVKVPDQLRNQSSIYKLKNGKGVQIDSTTVKY